MNHATNRTCGKPTLRPFLGRMSDTAIVQGGPALCCRPDDMSNAAFHAGVSAPRVLVPHAGGAAKKKLVFVVIGMYLLTGVHPPRSTGGVPCTSNNPRFRPRGHGFIAQGHCRDATGSPMRRCVQGGGCLRARARIALNPTRGHAMGIPPPLITMAWPGSRCNVVLGKGRAVLGWKMGMGRGGEGRGQASRQTDRQAGRQACIESWASD